ncbi:sensor histidine kinase [Bacillus coreaensis]
MVTYNHFILLISFFVILPIIGAVALLFIYLFEERIDALEHANKEIKLESELRLALYNQLNQQIQPHFFFNTLNVILSLARLKRTEELVRAIEVFSLYLKSKYQNNESMITIQKEWQYTMYFIEIQKLRFRDRLILKTEIDHELSHYYIPPFVLQTLVENAFKHGLEKQMGDASLQITLNREKDQIVLKVMDNGSIEERIEEPEADNGHGLENTRQRMKFFFGNETKLTISSEIGNLTEVKIVWPIKTKEDLEGLLA